LRPSRPTGACHDATAHRRRRPVRSCCLRGGVHRPDVSSSRTCPRYGARYSRRVRGIPRSVDGLGADRAASVPATAPRSPAGRRPRRKPAAANAPTHAQRRPAPETLPRRIRRRRPPGPAGSSSGGARHTDRHHSRCASICRSAVEAQACLRVGCSNGAAPMLSARFRAFSDAREPDWRYSASACVTPWVFTARPGVFDAHHHTAHVSAIDHPVFVNGRNYGGASPGLARHHVLRSRVRVSLGTWLDMCRWSNGLAFSRAVTGQGSGARFAG
jgi:hypothetical protein